AQNKAKGEAYLVENKGKEGVIVTESGLQYQVLREGKGKSPTQEGSAKVHYRGTLIDGTAFDSSYERNEPATFPVAGLIPGFTEGLLLMKEGAKYRLVIPSDIAYGERASGPIGPNEVLVFEVELLEVL
ncbi:MAG: FKBP-type peptidyl-prolyl cis-trans isomerase, partial [Arenicella sp.]|nr:FKBP-type peptidyl-prolyl cis-trans isomerase [Arenicella sp.]